MSTLIDALYSESNKPSKCSTENGNPAYSWEEKIFEEHFTQLYFQFVLTTDNIKKEIITNKYKLLFKQCIFNDDTEKINYMLKFIIHTRDIKDGKGLYELSYILLNIYAQECYETKKLNKFFFIKTIKNMVSEFEINGKKQLPYGSWKDIKYFINKLTENSREIQVSKNKKVKIHKEYVYSVINDIIKKIVVPQMIEDKKNMSIKNPVSLCCKWLPRESSNRFGWISDKIAKEFYNRVFSMNTKTVSIMKKYYRKFISKVNKYIDTTQIHMCKREWDKINFDHVTSLTMFKSKSAFLNTNNINEEHRKICKNNLMNYIENKINNNETIKGKNILPHYLVSEVLFNEMNNTQNDIINLQWKDLIETNRINNDNSFMNKCIPCIDVSPSMESDSSIPLTSAIGLGLSIIEYSNIKSYFTFSEIPQLIDAWENIPFTEQVQKIKDSEWGGTTDIFGMFVKLLNILKENNVPDEEVSEYSLIILSDMQFNACSYDSYENIEQTIKRKYRENGYNNIPYLVFWNLSVKNNFPSINKSEHSTMISGNNVSLLKKFMTISLNEIKTMTSCTLIKSILDNERYNIYNM